MIERTEAEQIEALNGRIVELLRERDAADQACQRLCGQHGFATGHGDTVADMVDEISGQIEECMKTMEGRIAGTRKALQKIADLPWHDNPQTPLRKTAREIAIAALSDSLGK